MYIRRTRLSPHKHSALLKLFVAGATTDSDTAGAWEQRRPEKPHKTHEMPQKRTLRSWIVMSFSVYVMRDSA